MRNIATTTILLRLAELIGAGATTTSTDCVMISLVLEILAITTRFTANTNTKSISTFPQLLLLLASRGYVLSYSSYEVSKI